MNVDHAEAHQSAGKFLGEIFQRHLRRRVRNAADQCNRKQRHHPFGYHSHRMSLPREVMIVAYLLAIGCGQRLSRFEYSQLHMGVQVRLTVYARDESTARTACAAAYARVAQLEDIMSDYREGSELMRLCRSPVDMSVAVSPELFYVLSRAQELAERSDGAFDVTVGPYVALWRAARKSEVLPSQGQLAQARDRVGWEYVRLNAGEQTVALMHSGMRLDLGGIAKGYAGDEAIKALRENGIRRALFEAGGDVVASDPPTGKRGWTIRIRAPGSNAPPVIQIANVAVSTSGDTEQFVFIN